MHHGGTTQTAALPFHARCRNVATLAGGANGPVARLFRFSLPVFIQVCVVWLQIEVLGQMALSTETFSYGAPVLLSTSPTTVPTLGITLGLVGTNFGYEPSKISILLNGVPVSGFTIQVCWNCGGLPVLVLGITSS
jgi:hypothetical protein